MNTPIVVSSFKNSHKRPILIAVGVVVILLLASLGGWLLWRGNKHMNAQPAANTQNSVCSPTSKNAILPQAADALEVSDLKELALLATQIRQSSGYAKDINCLYILTAYYLRVDNARQDQIYLNDFNAVYRHNRNVSSSLTGYIPVKNLQADVTAMVNAYRREQNNVYTIRQP